MTHRTPARGAAPHTASAGRAPRDIAFFDLEDLMAGRKRDNKRELIEPHGDKRYTRRNAQGEFTQQDDTGRSLGRDVRQHSKTRSKPGHGDEGDR